MRLPTLRLLVAYRSTATPRKLSRTFWRAWFVAITELNSGGLPYLPTALEVALALARAARIQGFAMRGAMPSAPQDPRCTSGTAA